MIAARPRLQWGTSDADARLIALERNLKPILSSRSGVENRTTSEKDTSSRAGSRMFAVPVRDDTSVVAADLREANSSYILGEVFIALWQAFLIIACIVSPIILLIWIAFQLLRPIIEFAL